MKVGVQIFLIIGHHDSQIKVITSDTAAAKNAIPTAQSHQNPKGRILTFPYLFYEHRISS